MPRMVTNNLQKKLDQVGEGEEQEQEHDEM
jgi:hypothetical protein